MVDIDKSEMNKNTLHIFKKFHHSLESFIPILEKVSRNKKNNKKHDFFLSWCKKIKSKYPISLIKGSNSK